MVENSSEAIQSGEESSSVAALIVGGFSECKSLIQVSQLSQPCEAEV